MTSLSKQTYHAVENSGTFNISFEVFPPTSESGQKSLMQVACDLEETDPAFFSVTYGAGGSSRQRTLDTLRQISRTTSLNLAGHLTCVGAGKNETDSIADQYLEMGVKRIVALRGDAPSPTQPYQPHPHGYENAADLVCALKQRGEFDISVAAYPETHPESASRKADIDNLWKKFDSGADRAITQFFFDNHHFIDFAEEAANLGLSQPIVPGILLIHDFTKVRRFAGLCHTNVPDWLSARFEGLEDDPSAHQLAAVSVAVEQVLDLAAQGVRDFHFYTMNRSDLALAVCRSLGVRPVANLRSVA